VRPAAAADHQVVLPAIVTHALTKRYKGARGIEELSFSVAPGEVFGFLGPNGAGKTTTIRTLLGLLRPTSGTAEILGFDVWRDGVAARARTGFLPGEFAFDEQVTGEELLDLFADLRGIDDRAFARSLAGRFEADLRRPLGELSRGNRQKIGLVQALVHRPAVLVMDEPTAGLDPLMQEEFARLVTELRGDGTTVFLSSHNLAEVERMCDRVGILREGRLAAVESVDDITGRALRHVRLRFAGAAPAGEFRRLPGVSRLAADGPELRFLLAGEPTEVVRAAGRHRLLDIEITRPSLEETFVAAYGHRLEVAA
jgi:ABC-2 type transport system ATP-binding protein